MNKNSLRPSSLNDIIGQKRLRDILKITLEASKIESRAIPHILLHGRAGYGKSSLALAIANDSGRPIQTANASSVKNIKDILPYLMKLDENSILFIDEIHALPQLVSEFLYPAMEDFKVDLVTKGEALTIPLPKFTLIAATTKAGSLSKPLRDRFVINETLDDYTNKDIFDILKINIFKLNLNIDEDAIQYISTISRLTPRIANNLVLFAKDYALSNNIKKISLESIKRCIMVKGINSDGLNIEDIKYLNLLKNSKTPLGINTIVANLDIDKDTIEQIIEPFLLQKQLIQKTTKGRIINEKINTGGSR